MSTARLWSDPERAQIHEQRAADWANRAKMTRSGWGDADTAAGICRGLGGTAWPLEPRRDAISYLDANTFGGLQGMRSDPRSGDWIPLQPHRATSGGGRAKPIAASAEKALPCRDWRLALPAD